MKCVVLISSFDGFSDAWELFFKRFDEFWPYCPFERYLITNYKKYPFALPVGEDKGWASNILKALDMIKTHYFIYLQEDYFLDEKVDTVEIQRMLRLMTNYNIKYIRLFPTSRPDTEEMFQNLRPIPKQRYRCSLQASIWEKKFFRKLCVEGETGWEFETKGNQRANEVEDNVMCVSEKLISYELGTGIQKGKWTEKSLRLKKQYCDQDR